MGLYRNLSATEQLKDLSRSMTSCLCYEFSTGLSLEAVYRHVRRNLNRDRKLRLGFLKILSSCIPSVTSFLFSLIPFFWWSASFSTGKCLLFCVGLLHNKKYGYRHSVPWIKDWAAGFKISLCPCQNKLFSFYSNQHQTRSIRIFPLTLLEVRSGPKYPGVCYPELLSSAILQQWYLLKLSKKKLLLLMSEAKYSHISLTHRHEDINLQDSRIEWWYIKLEFQLERHTLVSEYPYNDCDIYLW